MATDRSHLGHTSQAGQHDSIPNDANVASLVEPKKQLD